MELGGVEQALKQQELKCLCLTDHWVLAWCEEMDRMASSNHLVATPSNIECETCAPVDGKKLT